MKSDPWQRYTPLYRTAISSFALDLRSQWSSKKYAHAYGICATFYCISLNKWHGGGGYSAAMVLISRDIAKIPTQYFEMNNYINKLCWYNLSLISSFSNSGYLLMFFQKMKVKYSLGRQWFFFLSEPMLEMVMKRGKKYFFCIYLRRGKLESQTI